MVAIRLTRANGTLVKHHVTYADTESPRSSPKSSEELYRQIRKIERDIGGDSGLVGMSGSLSRPHMSSILEAMNVDSSSHFLDIGSGLGRPMLHALLHGSAMVSGIEFDSMKHHKCQTVISRVLSIEDQVKTCCHHDDIMSLKSLAEIDPMVTHVFSFWEGINIDAREAAGRLISMSRSKGGRISHVAFVQSYQNHLSSYMKELNFTPDLVLSDTFQVSMLGSASKFRAYVFRYNTPSVCKSPSSLAPPKSTLSCARTEPSLKRKRKSRKPLVVAPASLGDTVSVPARECGLTQRRTRSASKKICEKSTAMVQTTGEIPYKLRSRPVQTRLLNDDVAATMTATKTGVKVKQALSNITNIRNKPTKACQTTRISCTLQKPPYPLAVVSRKKKKANWQVLTNSMPSPAKDPGFHTTLDLPMVPIESGKVMQHATHLSHCSRLSPQIKRPRLRSKPSCGPMTVARTRTIPPRASTGVHHIGALLNPESLPRSSKHNHWPPIDSSLVKRSRSPPLLRSGATHLSIPLATPYQVRPAYCLPSVYRNPQRNKPGVWSVEHYSLCSPFFSTTLNGRSVLYQGTSLQAHPAQHATLRQ